MMRSMAGKKFQQQIPRQEGEDSFDWMLPNICDFNSISSHVGSEDDLRQKQSSYQAERHFWPSTRSYDVAPPIAFIISQILSKPPSPPTLSSPLAMLKNSSLIKKPENKRCEWCTNNGVGSYV